MTDHDPAPPRSDPRIDERMRPTDAAPTRTLEIDLGARSYPIHVGAGLLSDGAREGGSLLARHVPRRALVVTNETVAPLYLDRVLASLGNTPSEHVILPDGESHKRLETLEPVWETLLSGGFDRGCTLVALGGGVVGDMTGFAAASYQRGVDFVQLPTTLLAQVDSSVGGKTGVNHPLGKNMIGAFHQPVAVIADVAALDTLPDAELSAGLAEVIKYGFIVDAPFFAWLEGNVDALLARDRAATIEAVHRSCAIKARVVEADEREHGVRALLNLGHTFGHAIEAATGYGAWLHGEAVGAGIAMALDLAVRLGEIDESVRARGLALLERARLPVRAPSTMTADDFRTYMMRDKKVADGRLRLVVPGPIGSARVGADFDPDALDATLEAFAAPGRTPR